MLPSVFFMTITVMVIILVRKIFGGQQIEKEFSYEF